MSDVVKVQITAEITDLQAKVAVAKSEMRSLDSEVTKLSTEMQKAGEAGDAALGSSLKSTAVDASKAEQAVAKLSTEMETAGKSSGAALGSALKGAGQEALSAGQAVVGLEKDLEKTGSSVARFAELQTKLALARVEARQFEAEVTRLSTAMVTSGNAGDAVLGSALRAATLDAALAGRSVSTLEGELKKLVPAMHQTHGATSTATREFRALFDEITSGRTQNTPGTIAIIANRVFGLQGATLLAAGGVLALAGALGYLAYSAMEASAAVDRIDIGAKFAGNLNITKASVEQTISELRRLYGVSLETAQGIAGAFSKMRGDSEEQLRGLSLAIGQYIQATGAKPEEVLKSVNELLSKQRIGYEDLEKVFPGITHAQADAYMQTSRLGDEHQRIIGLLDLFGARMKGIAPDVAEYNAGVHASWYNFLQYFMALGAGIPMEEVHDALLKDNTKTWEEHAAAIKKSVEAMKAAGPTTDELLVAADKAATAQSTYGDRIQETRKQIKDLEAGLQAAKKTETGAALAKDTQRYTEALQEARSNLARLQQEQKNRSEMGTRLAGEQLINDARTTNAQIAADDTTSKQETIQRQIQTWSILLSSDKLTAQQRVQVERDLAQSIRQLHAQQQTEEKAAAREKEEIARNAQQTDLEISRVGVEEQRQLLEQQVQAGRITEQQKLVALRQLAEDELAINLAMLESSISMYDADEKEFARVENQKRLLRAQTASEIAKINAQIEQANNRTARDDVRAWRDATNEIISAERTFVQGMFAGNESLKMITLRTIDQILEKEIEADLAYLTKHMLFKEEELAADKTLEQGGLLVKYFTEGEKTAATAAGSASRGAIQGTEAAAENASFLVRAARWVAMELGLTAATGAGEAARTAETGAGEAARTAEKATALAAGKAAESAANVASAESYAAVAATGAAASVAWIPVVGPELAVAAAASTFAALQPFAAIAALETGTTDVPKNMPAFLHQGEMVVPKTFATGLRQLLSASPPVPSSPSAGKDVAVGDVHMHYTPTINAPERPTLPQLIEQDASFFVSWIHAQVRDGVLKIQPA